MFDSNRLRAAYEQARADLLAQRNDAGHWVGELSASALSTATAVSALSIVGRERTSNGGEFSVNEMIVRGINWLAGHQNADGGFGDTDKSYSNIATSMLVVAAMRLAGVADEHSDLVNRAEKYVELKGGIEGLRKRYGKDKTFAVPILTNGALAGMVPWRRVPALPFELACCPQHWWKFLRLPVVSYAIPALVAIGQARYFHQPPRNPLTRFIRKLMVPSSVGT